MCDICAVTLGQKSLPIPNEAFGRSDELFRTRFLPGVCHSSPFVGRQSPFRPFRQTHQPGFEIDAFDEMVEMEIVQQMGRSGTRLGFDAFSTFCRQNTVLTLLKRASNTPSEKFVRPSKIFVWEHKLQDASRTTGFGSFVVDEPPSGAPTAWIRSQDEPTPSHRRKRAQNWP